MLGLTGNVLHAAPRVGPPGAPMVAMNRKRASSPSHNRPTFARLNGFAAGQIWGMHQAGCSRAEIMEDVGKPDGSAVGKTVVDEVFHTKTADPAWRGEASSTG